MTSPGADSPQDVRPWLSRIRIFPVKSLDPLEVQEVRVHGDAGLEHDREFRLADAEGRSLNGKLLGEKIIGLRSEFDLAFAELTVRDGADLLRARLPFDAGSAQAWFRRKLGVDVRIEQSPHSGFPDDEEASGPTLISRATLETVAAWFDLDIEETRRRFRANLEIDGAPAFWEDQLFGPADAPSPTFRIGEVRLEAVNPCARCAVPTRDSRTGAVTPEFAKIFAAKRRETLPEWAEESRFDHTFRLAVNTRIPASENGKTIHVGQELVIDPVPVDAAALSGGAGRR